MFLDFQAIKRLASLRDIVGWLGLELKGDRCQCPVNEGDKREMVFTFDKGVWHCFGCKKKADPSKKTGGDQIELAAHVLQVSQKEAAEHIQTKFHGYTPAAKGLPDDGLQDLEYEHDHVQALGLTVERAQLLGIGWRNRGVLGKGVHIPVRDVNGKPLGYVRFNPQLEPSMKVANSLLK